MGRTRTRTAAGVVLDTGALLALERGDKRMIALLHRALAQARAFRVPAGVVGQAWRNGRVQVILARFLRSEEVEFFHLTTSLPVPAENSAAPRALRPGEAGPHSDQRS